NDELQALFDAVAEQAAEPAAVAATEESAAAASEGVVYNRLGQLARQVHDALRELGLDTTLHQAAEAVPDARQRLAYVARTTE
ncbi:protein phosphatase CheZ, partial [Citrobacter sp. AAK_AS5]